MSRSAEIEAGADLLAGYADDGFAIVRGLLSGDEVAALRERATRLFNASDDSDGMHRERDATGGAAQVYDAHRLDDAFRAHCRDARLLDPVKRLLGPQIYVWHSKLNVKAPLHGAPWLWHQDYGYWHREGVEPRMVTVAILLDRARTFGGGLVFLRGSHRGGLQPHVLDETATVRPQRTLAPAVRAALGDEDVVEVHGEPGDVVFFHANLAHASGQNLSAEARRMFLVVFNAADNRPTVDTGRPDWVVARSPELL